MFGQKIQSLQQRIIELEQQQQQYIALDSETNNALALLSKIREQAAALGEIETVSQMFLEVLQPVPTSSPAPQELDLEARVQQVVTDFRRDTELCEVLETPLPTTEELDRRVEKVVGEFEDEYLLSKAMGLDLPDQKVLEQRIQAVVESVPIQVEATLETSNKYSTPEELKAALAAEDPETILMEIANILDAAPATEIQGKAWYFARNLPMELCDRIIGYLPKSIIPEWRKQMDSLAEEAKASIFPPAEQPAATYEPAIDDIVECLSSGQVGRITYLCDSPQGKMATVLVPGGASNFHVSNLKYISKYEGEKPEEAPNTKHVASETVASHDDEIDQLAKQCLGLRSWSQIRIFCDNNPAVITRMQEIASTKTEKRLVNNLPSLIIGYIERANDRSDLQWLPEPILSEVEVLLVQPQVTAIA